MSTEIQMTCNPNQIPADLSETNKLLPKCSVRTIKSKQLKTTLFYFKNYNKATIIKYGGGNWRKDRQIDQ